MSYLSQFFRFLTAPLRWLLALPMWVISSPRRVMGLSLPARAALLVFIVLLVCTIAAVIAIHLNLEAGSVWNKIWDWKFLLAVILVFLIPVVVYYWLRLWLEGDVARFPDLDAAWREGLQALDSHGVDLASMPVFLVIGAPDDRLTKSLFRASGFEWVVRDTPAGLAPLRFYADDKGVYLACIATGRLGRLHQLGRSESPHQSSSANLRTTMAPAGNVRGTIVAGGAPVRDTAFAGDARESSGEPEANMLRGTLVAGAPTGGSRGGGGSAVSPSSGSSMLSRADADLESERLQYICELLRRHRQPVCPINGILVLLPFEIVQHVMVAKDIPAAIKSDLQVIRSAAQLLCPVTALVTGMERESGFGELVRRVGTSKAKTNRFGKGFDVWNAPTAENVDAFSSHACGAFEDWVYNLFRDRDGLNKPGNAKLYVLLCKIRSEVRNRLRNILLYGFSFDPNAKDADEKPLLFNGCYFAATGEADDRQAFVRNVFDKMLDMEEELEWTGDAVREDERYHRLAQVGMFVNGVLVLALIGMFVARYWWKE